VAVIRALRRLALHWRSRRIARAADDLYREASEIIHRRGLTQAEYARGFELAERAEALRLLAGGDHVGALRHEAEAAHWRVRIEQLSVQGTR
jgi:hypothetical protein